MTDHQQEDIVAAPSGNDVPPELELGESGRSLVEPQNQQDYWRWVQFQVLRERMGKSSLRE